MSKKFPFHFYRQILSDSIQIPHSLNKLYKRHSAFLIFNKSIFYSIDECMQNREYTYPTVYRKLCMIVVLLNRDMYEECGQGS